MSDYNQYNPTYDDNKKIDTVYVSKQHNFNKKKVRYVEEILSADEVVGLLKEKDSVILKKTSGGRQKIKATLYEEPNRVTALHIARTNTESGNPFNEWQACFYGEQLKKLYTFLSKILSINYSNEDKFKISDNELKSLPTNTDNLYETIVPDFFALKKSNISNDELLTLVSFLENNQDFWIKAKEEGLNFDDIYSSLRIKERKSIIQEFHSRLQNMDSFKEDKGDYNWQKWFDDKKWLFGNDVAEIIKERKTEPSCTYDYLTKNCEGFVDLIEIKDPKISFWTSKKDHNNYIPSTDLIKAITQSATYIHKLELRSNDKDIFNKIGNIVKPRCTILLGRSNDWDSERYDAFRILNSSYHNINIITYDMLLKRAENIYDIDSNNHQQVAQETDIDDEIPF